MDGEGLTRLLEERASTALRFEVFVPKPGNVSRNQDLADKTYDDFIGAIDVLGPYLGQLASSDLTGECIARASSAMMSSAGQNTHLGSIILLAPLLRGSFIALRDEAEPVLSGISPEVLRNYLSNVVDGMGPTDVRAFIEAVRQIGPPLPPVDRYDLTGPEFNEVIDIGMRDFMRSGSPDPGQIVNTISREYVTDLEITFEQLLPAFLGYVERWTIDIALRAVFIDALSIVPDALIHAKFGEETARSVSSLAGGIRSAGNVMTEEGAGLEDDLNKQLVMSGMNPGTTADLTVSVLFVSIMVDPGNGDLMSKLMDGAEPSGSFVKGA